MKFIHIAKAFAKTIETLQPLKDVGIIGLGRVFRAQGGKIPPQLNYQEETDGNG